MIGDVLDGPGYNPAALAEVKPSTATITTFVLVDVVTGHPFNRPAGTTGTNDTPYNQPVPPPQPAPTTPTTGQGNQPDIDGTYLWHWLTHFCGDTLPPDRTVTMTHQGSALTMVWGTDTWTGTLNSDGSFALSTGAADSMRGVFATEGGRTVIRDVVVHDYRVPPLDCGGTFTGTKQ